jgi:5,6-dimethylbenzimidazole synthase
MNCGSKNFGSNPPSFDAAFQAQLATLIAWRRDVRRFSDRPVPQSLIETLLDTAQLSPSVGNSQPWRWVQVESPARRAEIRTIFANCNAAACLAQPSDRARAYASLKLEGMDRAPLQFAVLCDQATGQGFGLGRHTMPEMLEYSTVAMVSTFWLAARAAGLGVGWISILDPQKVCRVLDVAQHWKLVAYLCVGWPETNHLDPELQRFGWQCRTSAGRQVAIR